MIAMARIEKKIEKNKDLTILVVTGKVSSDEITDALRDFYKSGFTLKLLLDFSNSEFSDLPSDQLPLIISVAKSYAHLREGGKTAIVMSSGVGFGIGRMYETLSEIEQHPITHNICKSIDEAMDWLES